MDLESVDRILNDMGITEGGQHPTATLDEVGEKLGADGSKLWVKYLEVTRWFNYDQN